MKYELIGKNDYFLNPIETILKNRGIEDIQSFLNISENNIIHWSKLHNIEKAIDCLLGHIEKGNKIFVQVDSDADGITSTAILINYLKSVFKDIDITWRMQDGKEHGVILKTVPEDIQLVIIPDAGSNQFEEHKNLKEKGIDVIVLDHHECNEESKDAIVVNSQISPEYTNKDLTGAGIVYKFCKGLDHKLGINLADNYLDLVSVGNIGDMADSRELETRYYMLDGLKKIKNKMLNALFLKQEYSTKGVVNIINTQFYIVPLINAAIRTGTQEEKEQMMRAFLETDEEIYYKKKEIYEDIYTSTARLLGNIKARQGRLRDKGVTLIKERIEEKNLLDNKILIVNVTEILDKNLTGLVANELIKQYKRPALLLRQRDEVLGGSARGYDKGVIKDFKQFLTETGKFIYCEGHGNAFGVEIEPEKIIEVNDLINEHLKDVDVNVDIHDVDFIIPAKQLTNSIIEDLHSLRDTWGQKVEEPLLAIKDIEISKDEIYINGSKKNTLKFIYKGIEFIKFSSSEDEWDSIVSQGETLVIDVVGRCSVNIYKDKKTPQIIIDDYEITKTKKKKFNF
ncbi:DHH family phosphoesterase [Metabacillus sp. Hm71]|uniref:DHH family phosphoesterase n=1 Tax=Metabacillus sp. Hm71 TaxID=3450743 RepID=UPI003F424DF4